MRIKKNHVMLALMASVLFIILILNIEVLIPRSDTPSGASIPSIKICSIFSLETPFAYGKGLTPHEYLKKFGKKAALSEHEKDDKNIIILLQKVIGKYSTPRGAVVNYDPQIKWVIEIEADGKMLNIWVDCRQECTYIEENNQLKYPRFNQYDLCSFLNNIKEESGDVLSPTRSR